MAALGALQSLASGPAEAIPAKLEEAFNALTEPDRTRLGAGALERLVACLQDLGLIQSPSLPSSSLMPAWLAFLPL